MIFLKRKKLWAEFSCERTPQNLVNNADVGRLDEIKLNQDLLFLFQEQYENTLPEKKERKIPAPSLWRPLTQMNSLHKREQWIKTWWLKGGKGLRRWRREGLTTSQKITPLALYNYIVQPDVKRCQKSRGANPVLMNENRWTRQWSVQPPRARLLYGGVRGASAVGGVPGGDQGSLRQTEEPFLSGEHTFEQFDPLQKPLLVVGVPEWMGSE